MKAKIIRLTRRSLMTAALGAGVARARAQGGGSTRTLRIVIGFAPGSVADTLARLVARPMSMTLGQSVIVENRPGAGSNLAAEFVSRASKDSEVLFMSTVANTINASTSLLSFNFERDLTPMALLASVPHVLVVHPSLGVSTTRELIALALKKPGQIQYASSGVGTLAHFCGELMNKTAGIEMTHVPYAGSAQGLSDVLSGRVGVMFSPLSTVQPFMRDGQLKALATTQARRSPITPDLPTMAEGGLDGYDAAIWIGLVGPSGMPNATARALAEAASNALRDASVVAAMQAQSIEPVGGTPEAFSSYIHLDIDKWSRLAKGLNLAP